MGTVKYISRSIDHLGDLGAKLRDLQGFSTLAFELIQNADDVKEATSMSFDVSDSALIVDNDGVFSDCQHSEESKECPWKKDKSKEYRCDFHRFRNIVSGDKRREADTTGAFGIGFIAVYQVTDTPELISGGRHWILHEEEPEDQRIEVCPGCPECKASDLPGTRFILPWATNPHSAMRQGLQAESIAPNARQIFIEEIEKALPIAMLFLKRIRKVVIKMNGKVRHSFEREKDNDSLILSDGNPINDKIWRIIEGEFRESAENIRAEHPNKIEEKKSANITIAIPRDNQASGLICAYLPTQQDTKLPFHINADFFTSSDRKRIHLDDGFQANWNRAALKAAAMTLANNITDLTHYLGHKRFWNFLSKIWQVADVERAEHAYAEFWQELEPNLSSLKIVYTTKDYWVSPSDAVLLLQKEEAAAIPALEEMDFNIVSEDLRSYHNLLRYEQVDVPLLDIRRMYNKFENDGLTCRTKISDLPKYLAEQTFREKIWAQISLMLGRHPQREIKLKEENEQLLKKIAIAPGLDGALWPCGEIYKTNKEAVTLFKSCSETITFLKEDHSFSPLSYLCPEFDTEAAIKTLLSIDETSLATAWSSGKLALNKLFTWFENNKKEFLENATLIENISKIPIFPSSGKLHKLNDLVLPGDFIDELNLAEIVDLSALGGHREFLQFLGMKELDFRNYVLTRIPMALNNEKVSADKRRAVVSLLVKRLGEIKDDQEIKNALMLTPLIECDDGKFRKAAECYLKNETISDCLGDQVHYVVLRGDQTSAVYDLYVWLGIATSPRTSDLMERINELTKYNYSERELRIIENIFKYLGESFGNQIPEALEELRNISWLPAKGKNGWYRPGELYNDFRAYLFQTQALFLNISNNIQKSSSDFMKFVGIKTEPSVILVTKHILQCSERGLSVPTDIYRFLNDNSEDASINLLRDSKCLYLDNKYLAPTEVFWGEHPFGRYRHRLSEEFRSYSKFMQKIGVCDVPNHEDALRLLREISSEFSSTSSPLDDEAHGVLMECWRMLEKSYLEGNITTGQLAELCKAKCIPNDAMILHPPEWMFFENRVGLAAKFGDFLKHNVISRPVGAAKVISAAGVRNLGSAVETELLEYGNPYEDIEIKSIILKRKNQIGRVLESQLMDKDVLSALNSLDELKFNATSLLKISYHVRVFHNDRRSQPEEVHALYVSKDNSLMFTKKNGKVVSWASIARELAIALFPEEDPGKVAAGIKEVLTADSAEAATATLDELGFAGLDTSISTIPASGQAITKLGADSVTPFDTPYLPPDNVIRDILGKDETTTSQSGKDTDAGPPHRVVPGKGKTRPILRSYLSVTDESIAGDQEDKAGVRNERNQVDEEGIKRVLDYETKSGRNPKEMPHNNPGYDIESRDEKGKIVRYIEVKSFSGSWNSAYAVLSKEQFDFGYKGQELFWLYVVEFALNDSFKIYQIHNPSLQANHFMFDDGWRSFAEVD